MVVIKIYIYENLKNIKNKRLFDEEEWNDRRNSFIHA